MIWNSKQETLQKIMRQTFISLDSQNQFSGGSNVNPLKQQWEIFSLANSFRILVSENKFGIKLENSYCLLDHRWWGEFPRGYLWKWTSLSMMQWRKIILQPIWAWVSVETSRMAVVLFPWQAYKYWVEYWNSHDTDNTSEDHATDTEDLNLADILSNYQVQKLVKQVQTLIVYYVYKLSLH